MNDNLLNTNSQTWKSCRLGDVITLKRGYDLPSNHRTEGNIPVISSSGLSGQHNVPKVQGPGVITGRYGTLGEVFFIETDFWPLNTTLYVQSFHDNNPRFVYYLLKTLNFSNQNIAAAVPGINRNHLHEMKVVVPLLPEQRRIAHILSTLDDKIELNRRMNATLEAMARALFRSWFVDFDPVRAKVEGRQPAGMDEATAALFPDAFEASEIGEIPKGWDVASLDEIANFLNGLALQNFRPQDGEEWLPVIKIAQLKQEKTSDCERACASIKPDCIINDGDIIFSWSGSLEVVIWCGGKGALNQHLFKVTSSSFPKWFYYQWLLFHLDDFRTTAQNKATTMGHIQRHHLTDAKVLIPPAELLDLMSKMMNPLIGKIITLKVQSRTLAALRDALLPRLLSSELSMTATATPGDVD